METKINLNELAVNKYNLLKDLWIDCVENIDAFVYERYPAHPEESIRVICERMRAGIASSLDDTRNLFFNICQCYIYFLGMGQLYRRKDNVITIPETIKSVLYDLELNYGIYFGYLIGYSQDHKTALKDIFDTMSLRQSQITNFLLEHKVDYDTKTPLPIIPYLDGMEFNPLITFPLFGLPNSLPYKKFKDLRNRYNYEIKTNFFEDEMEEKETLIKTYNVMQGLKAISHVFYSDFPFLGNQVLTRHLSLEFQKIISWFMKHKTYKAKHKIVCLSLIVFKNILKYISNKKNNAFHIQELNDIPFVVRALARNCIYVGHYVGIDQPYKTTTCNEAKYSFENCFLRSKIAKLEKRKRLFRTNSQSEKNDDDEHDEHEKIFKNNEDPELYLYQKFYNLETENGEEIKETIFVRNDMQTDVDKWNQVNIQPIQNQNQIQVMNESDDEGDIEDGNENDFESHEMGMEIKDFNEDEEVVVEEIDNEEDEEEMILFGIIDISSSEQEKYGKINRIPNNLLALLFHFFNKNYSKYK